VPIILLETNFNDISKQTVYKLYQYDIKKVKGKAVPQHTYGGARGERRYSYTH
jgi:hypothetical protein